MHRYLSQVPSRLRNRLPLYQRREGTFVRQLCNGDGNAWVQLLDDWSPRLYSYVSYNVTNEADVRKLIRLILSELIQTMMSAQPVENLTVVIFALAYQQLLHYRRHAPDPFVESAWLRHQGGIAGDTLPPWFRQHLQQFSPEVQQLLLLRYLCGVTLPELAQIVGQSEELLTKILYRTRFYSTYTNNQHTK